MKNCPRCAPHHLRRGGKGKILYEQCMENGKTKWVKLKGWWKCRTCGLVWNEEDEDEFKAKRLRYQLVYEESRKKKLWGLKA